MKIVVEVEEDEYPDVKKYLTQKSFFRCGYFFIQGVAVGLSLAFLICWLLLDI